MTASNLSEHISYLKTLPAIRERASRVYEKAKNNSLDHFHFNLARIDAVAALIKALIDRDYSSPKEVPGHSRWRHFDVGGLPRVQNLLNEWTAKGVDVTEQARRTIDLFVVSVLLDAGAGSAWNYTEKATGTTFARSEGLAIASLEMFLCGAFSSDKENEPHRVDAVALSALTPDELRKGFQADGQTNPLIALEGRCQLVNRLGTALAEGTEWFGGEDTKCARPGNLVDYLLKHPLTTKDSGIITIQLSSLWPAIVSGFAPVWPATRTRLGGIALGDVWPLYQLSHGTPPSSLNGSLDPEKLVPFHKLSQWLTYSLLDALTHTLTDIHVSGTSDLTGLPEYRNGGLLIDMGVLVLKEADRERGLVRARNEMDKAQDRNWGDCPPACEVVPVFEVWDPVVVEWRACTVAILDEIAEKVGTLIGSPIELAKVLEAGTWKGGRELAAKMRPISKGPPIGIVSDGTVF